MVTFDGKFSRIEIERLEELGFKVERRYIHRYGEAGNEIMCRVTGERAWIIAGTAETLPRVQVTVFPKGKNCCLIHGIGRLEAPVYTGRKDSYGGGASRVTNFVEVESGIVPLHDEETERFYRYGGSMQSTA